MKFYYNNIGRNIILIDSNSILVNSKFWIAHKRREHIKIGEGINLQKKILPPF